MNGGTSLSFLPGDSVVIEIMSPRTCAPASTDGAVSATISSSCAKTPAVKSEYG